MQIFRALGALPPDPQHSHPITNFLQRAWLSLPKLTSFCFSYAILLFIIILKVYFFIFLEYSNSNDSFSSHGFHLMVNTAIASKWKRE